MLNGDRQWQARDYRLVDQDAVLEQSELLQPAAAA
jgi:hypothetical protein